MSVNTPIFQYRESEPQSISHWGMIDLPMPLLLIVPADFEIDESLLRSPGHIMWVERKKYEWAT